MKNQNFLFLLMLFSVSSIFAQVTITGKVLDEGGFPLPGAQIIELETQNGTTTDFDGNFEFTTKKNTGKIAISFLGYKKQELLFSSTIKRFDNVQLALSNDLLSEVVLVGYKKKALKDATEAVVNVTSVDKIDSRPIINAAEILQGNAAGVAVLNDGGDPTRTPIVRIRGISTMNPEAPLVVVDGIPELPMPNPSDIESISVLKDASAAVYGARASGGVILVTTKKGTRGKSSLNINLYSGFQSVANDLRPLTAKEYISVMSQAFENDGQPKSASLLNLEKNVNSLPNNNWLDMIFRTGIITNYDVSFSGGGEKSRFYAGVNHRKTEGVLLNSYIQKSSLRLNSDFTIGKNLKIGENLAVTHSDGNYGINTTSPEQGVVFIASSTRAFHPLQDDQGRYAGENDLRHPVDHLKKHDEKRPTINLSGNLFLEYKFLNNFTFNSKLGANKTLRNDRKFVSAEVGFTAQSLERRNYDYFSWLAENSISYQNTFDDKHKLDVLLGHSLQRNEGSYFSAFARNFPEVRKELHYLDTSVKPEDRVLSGGPILNNSLISLIGKLDYSYADKYYFTATVRRDGSSKLAPGNRWGTFPAFSLAWRISNEDFMKNAKWMDNLKLRASYGRLGNLGILGDFGYKGTINPKGTFTLINGQWVDGLEYKSPSNPNLKWEEIVQTNIGLDGELLDKSLYFTFDYFIKRTENMLLASTLPAVKGYKESPQANSGKVENRGFEALIGYKKSNENFSFDVSANFSVIKNEVKDLGSLERLQIKSKTVKDYLDPILTRVGKPLTSFHVVETDGIFQNQEQIDAYTKDGNKIQPNAKPGDLKFVDANGDGKIDSKDRVFKGSSFPDMTFGLNFNAEYKGLELSMLWQGALGVQVFNGLKALSYIPRNNYNALSYATNAWSPNNTDTDMPRLTLSDPNKNYKTQSDWFLEDASYLRLKNITLGYNIPTQMFNTSFGTKVYVTGRNLLTFTGYSGFDPEVETSTGVDVGYYPAAKSVILGVNLKF